MTIIISIAFCDDDHYELKLFSDITSKLLSSLNIEYDIELFSSAESFLTDLKKHSQLFDIIFLDIDMPHIDGITLCRKIRNVDKDVLLSFISSKEDRVYDAFGYDVYRFIRKNSPLAQIQFQIKECILHCQSQNSIYWLPTEEGLLKFKSNELIYFERQLRKFYVQTLTKHLRLKIKTFEELNQFIQDASCFEMINRSCMINLSYVTGVNPEQLITLEYLDHQQVFSLSRNRKDSFYTKFLNFSS